VSAEPAAAGNNDRKLCGKPQPLAVSTRCGWCFRLRGATAAHTAALRYTVLTAAEQSVRKIPPATHRHEAPSRPLDARGDAAARRPYLVAFERQTQRHKSRRMGARGLQRCRPGRAHLESAPDRGRSPSAACRPAEADWKNSVLLRLAKRCEPGRFAVRRGQCRDAPGPVPRPGVSLTYGTAYSLIGPLATRQDGHGTLRMSSGRMGASLLLLVPK